METKWLNVIRDIISIAVGAFGLVHSQITGNANSWLVVAYLALLGQTAVANLLELRQSKRSDEDSSGSPPSRP